MDLSTDAVKSYWEKKDQSLAQVLFTMLEPQEQWVLDDDDTIKPKLEKLAAALENSEYILNSPEKKKALIKVLSFISASKALRIMAKGDAIQGTLEQTLTEVLNAEDDIESQADKVFMSAVKVFLHRLVTLERSSVLLRVFSKERVELLHAVLSEV